MKKRLQRGRFTIGINRHTIATKCGNRWTIGINKQTIATKGGKKMLLERRTVEIDSEIATKKNKNLHSGMRIIRINGGLMAK